MSHIRTHAHTCIQPQEVCDITRMTTHMLSRNTHAYPFDTFPHDARTHMPAYMYTATGGKRHHSHDYPHVVYGHPAHIHLIHLHITHICTRTYTCVLPQCHGDITHVTTHASSRDTRAYPFDIFTHYAHTHLHEYSHKRIPPIAQTRLETQTPSQTCLEIFVQTRLETLVQAHQETTCRLEICSRGRSSEACPTAPW